MARLTGKRKAFVEAYLQCFNASEAARRAGYKSRANTAGQRLLSNVDIQAAIKDYFAEKAMGTDEVLSRLAAQARGDMTHFLHIDKSWARIDLEKAKEAGMLPLIKKVRQTKAGLEVELYDAQAALQLIGKHLRLFNDVQEHEGDISVHVVYEDYNPEPTQAAPGASEDQE